LSVVSTGIEGLDEILNGGFPRRRVILVTGGPGTGKTVFATQYLYHGAVNLGEKGVFISLEEPIERIKENMANFGFNLEKLIKAGKLSFVELTPIQFTTIKPSGLIHLIREKVTPEVKRLVIDPLTTIMLQEKDIYQ
jgi:circadian clock protein KaiC